MKNVELNEDEVMDLIEMLGAHVGLCEAEIEAMGEHPKGVIALLWQDQLARSNRMIKVITDRYNENAAIK